MTYVGNMVRFTTRIDNAGRMLLPAPVRRALGMTNGSEVIITVQNGQAVVRTRASAIAEAQAYFTKLGPKTELWSDELSSDRRREAHKVHGR